MRQRHNRTAAYRNMGSPDSTTIRGMDHLPVFLDLRDRLTLVVGGGAVAARKVELLLKAHARVRVVAPRLDTELALYRDAGRIEARGRDFEPRISTAPCWRSRPPTVREVNHAVAAAGAARGVFVNVVDDGAASSCLMPAIVDRSPHHRGHRHLRPIPDARAPRARPARGDSCPSRLGELARLAGRARERVRRTLPDIDRRRRFWDRLFAGSIASTVSTPAHARGRGSAARCGTGAARRRHARRAARCT